MNKVDLKTEPSEWTRMKWVYSAICVLLTILQILNALWAPQPPAAPLILFTNTLAATALGGFMAHDLWKMKVRHWPLVIDILIYAVIFLGLLALMFLKETGAWNWNSTHLDVPLFVLFTVSTTAAWITEKRKKVKIYLGARGFLFIRTQNDL